MDGWVEAGEVVRVAADDLRVMVACGDYDCGVYDVGRVGAPAEDASELRNLEVEWLDEGSDGADESREPSLASALPPHLSYHPGRHDDRGAIERGNSAECEHLSVALLDRDKRAGVEDYCACS